jgi:hypothetical protein
MPIICRIRQKGHSINFFLFWLPYLTVLILSDLFSRGSLGFRSSSLTLFSYPPQCTNYHLLMRLCLLILRLINTVSYWSSQPGRHWIPSLLKVSSFLIFLQQSMHKELGLKYNNEKHKFCS